MNTEEDIMNEKVISVDDYISRGSVIDAIRYRVCQGQGNKEHICKRGSCAYCGIMEIMCDISSIPSADVQPIDRWIDAQKNPPPIIDRRSMTSESVLILRDNGRCAVAYYCNSAEDGDYWTTDDDKTMYCWEEVTHWQPLPEPPKDGEQNV